MLPSFLDVDAQRLAVEEPDLLLATRRLVDGEGWVGGVAPHRRSSARHVFAERPLR
jgi:hypothetical protein